jgi:hypothetical protein
MTPESARKITAATQRLRVTRASIERLPPSEAKAHAMIQLDIVARTFADGVARALKR